MSPAALSCRRSNNSARLGLWRELYDRLRGGRAMADMPLRFALVPGWEQFRPGPGHRDVAGVAVDSRDRVYLFCRDEHPVTVYDRAGRFLRAWGAGLFPRA